MRGEERKKEAPTDRPTAILLDLKPQPEARGRQRRGGAALIVVVDEDDDVVGQVVRVAVELGL